MSKNLGELRVRIFQAVAFIHNNVLPQNRSETALITHRVLQVRKVDLVKGPKVTQELMEATTYLVSSESHIKVARGQVLFPDGSTLLL